MTDYEERTRGLVAELPGGSIEITNAHQEFNVAEGPGTITLKLIQPNEMPQGNPHLGYDTDMFKLDVISDGTTTTATLSFDGDKVGRGVARRRRGERRNEVASMALAMARALRDAADGYEEAAEEAMR